MSDSIIFKANNPVPEDGILNLSGSQGGSLVYATKGVLSIVHAMVEVSAPADPDYTFKVEIGIGVGHWIQVGLEISRGQIHGSVKLDGSDGPPLQLPAESLVRVRLKRMKRPRRLDPAFTMMSSFQSVVVQLNTVDLMTGLSLVELNGWDDDPFDLCR